MSSAAPTPVSTDAPRRDAANRFARSLARMAQGIRLYGEQHAATTKAAAEVVESLNAWPAGAGSLELGIAPSGFLLGAESLSSASGVDELAHLFDGARLAAVAFSAEASADDLLTLIRTLFRERSHHWREDDARALADATGSRVRVTPVRYGSLRSSSGAGTDAGFAWSALVESVCGSPGDLSADEVALALGQRLMRATAHAQPAEAGQSGPPPEPSTDAHALASMLADTIRTAAPGERQRMVTKVSAVLERLAPPARARLISIDQQAAAQALGTLAELADALDPGELLMALDAVPDACTLACSESVRLFSKLARAARGNSGLSGGLRALMGRATASGSNPAFSASMRSLGDLLERQTAAEFNPEQYQAMLDRLAGDGPADPTPQPTESIRARWTDPGAHTALILADLASSHDLSPGDAPPIFARLERALENLVSGNHVAPLALAAVAAERFLADPSAVSDRPAYAKFLGTLRSADLIARVLALNPLGSPGARTAIDLVKSLGPETVAGALCAAGAAANPRADLAALLTECARDAGPIIRALASGPPGAAWVRSRLLPADAHAALAALLAEHPDPALALDGFVALHAIREAWSRDQVAKALAHPAERVRVLGVDRARALPETERLALLRPALRQVLTSPMPLPVLGALVQVLSACGPEGERAIVRTCSALLGKPTPAHIGLVQSILDAIYARFDGTGRVRAFRRAWLLAQITYGALVGRNR